MNKAILKNYLLFIWALLACGDLLAQQNGNNIIKLNFDRNKDAVWEGGKYKLVTKEGNSAVRIKSKVDNKFTLDLPVEKMRGATAIVKARLKTQNISTPPNNWNGVKIMLHIVQPWIERWPQALVNRTSDNWQDVTLTTNIPETSDSVQLVFGLEKVKGTLWIDYIEVSLATAPTVTNIDSIDAHLEYRTQYRGAMIPPSLSTEGVKDLARWGANLIRWQLIWDGFPASGADTATIDQYADWLDRALAHFDTMLPICRQLGIKVVLDLHTLPGGRNERNELRLFTDAACQKFFIDAWQKMAAKYKGEPTIWAYDIANEPTETAPAEGVANWQSLATETAKKIRAIDTTHPIIVEGADGGSPWGLLDMRRIQVPGIVYSFHMYEPVAFTHQGLYNNASDIRYPLKIGRTEWNRATLKQLLGEIRKWQVRNNADIYVGEFSAVRWAPGESAYYYLRDCIELFEEFGWDWSYHAFREYDGWSVEHGNDRDNNEPEKTPTLRKQLLLEWYGKNKH